MIICYYPPAREANTQLGGSQVINGDISQPKLTSELLEQIHACQQEILDEFVRLCEQLGLRYYLAYGTLLGAIRHHGPIPWDDDIDVMMPRNDMEVLRKHMLSQKGQKYHIHCFENDPHFGHFVIRINRSGTCYKTLDGIAMQLRYHEVWFDIFPLDEVPNTHWAAWISFLRRITINKSLDLKNKRSIKGKLLHALLRPVPLRSLRACSEYYMCHWNGKGCPLYMSTGGPYPAEREVMPRMWFEKTDEVLYMGKYYKVPREFDKILTHIYGDYMQLPPENKRVNHRPVEVKL